MTTDKRFGFRVPETEQGRNVKAAVDSLFSNDLPGTESWSLFADMAQRPPLLAAHRRQVAGAIIAIVNGQFSSEDAQLLTAVHRDVNITGEQFDQMGFMLLGRLAQVGEVGTARALEEVMPTFREVWVRE